MVSGQSPALEANGVTKEVCGAFVDGFAMMSLKNEKGEGE